MKFRALVPALLLACAAFADDLAFSPGTVDLGALEQGDSKTVSVKATNLSKKTMKFVDCVAQGRGPRNLAWPRQLKPGESGTLSFEFVSSGLRGTIEEHVTLVEEGEITHPVLLVGSVDAPVELWPAMVDFGWISPKGGEATLYAFSPKKPEFKLAFDASQADGLFAAKIEPVKLDSAGYPERLAESKSAKAIPGWKIVLKIDPAKLPADRKSLGVLGSFSSPDFPRASVEFYAVGYREQKK